MKKRLMDKESLLRNYSYYYSYIETIVILYYRLKIDHEIVPETWKF